MKISFIETVRAIRRQRRVRASVASLDNTAQKLLDRFAEHAEVPMLTSEERLAIDATWGKHSSVLPGDAFFRLAKFAHGFDSQYVPESMLYTFIQWNLNPQGTARCLEDKGIYGFYFKDFARPFEPVRRIRGVFYSHENEVLTEEVALGHLLEWGQPFIIKPSVESEQGRNVLLVEDYNRERLQELFQQYKQDFVCQERCTQCAQTQALNPTSLNCVRVTSLFLNGRYSVLSLTLKVGGQGNVMDNVARGGYLIGVHASGKLHDKGFDTQGNVRFTTYDGVSLNTIQIPNFEELLAFARRLHECVPQLPILGWDIAVDAACKPVLIEVNAYSPGVVYEQMCTGPIFADRFDEVMDYVSRQK